MRDWEVAIPGALIVLGWIVSIRLADRTSRRLQSHGERIARLEGRLNSPPDEDQSS